MSTDKTKSSDMYFYFAILVALANLGVFSLLFGAMWYFELLGADPLYFDDGTINNLKLINSVITFFGFKIDPSQPHKISTLMWSAALGFAFVSSFFAIVVANRRPNTEYEVTAAIK
ncbi:MAG: hypothetical protein LW817_03295 [Candidatus Caenarcaniphilales bacterium]|jgi:hypothetical protein|nr:hypothetical protein [Candidatus Caenarcaniphilales bacterium]